MADTTSFAHENGVQTLYKFMSYPAGGNGSDANAERRRQHVEALIRDGELYFPTASELNDPYDAALCFRIPGNSAEDREAFLRDLAKHAQRRGWSEEQRLAFEKDYFEGLPSGASQARLKGVADMWREKFRRDYPVCCLAATRENTLMWSYYSGGHTGVCIHIDARLPPFTEASPVTYTKQYPEFSFFHEDLEPEEFMRRALLTKSHVWCHEHEYRLINMPATFAPGRSDRVLDHPIFRAWITWKAPPKLALISPKIVRGVSVGVSMKEDEIESILRLCHDRVIPIPVFQARCAEDRFDLRFERIS